jgi:hypothetical protein
MPVVRAAGWRIRRARGCGWTGIRPICWCTAAAAYPANPSPSGVPPGQHGLGHAEFGGLLGQRQVHTRIHMVQSEGPGPGQVEPVHAIIGRGDPVRSLVHTPCCGR